MKVCKKELSESPPTPSAQNDGEEQQAMDIQNPTYRALIESAPKPRRRQTTPRGCGTEGVRVGKVKKKPVTDDELQVQRSQANIRERQRTLLLNRAFSELRKIIPTIPSDKLSKIQTLKLAANYISFLGQVKEAAERSECWVSCESGSGQLRTMFSAWRHMEAGASYSWTADTPMPMSLPPPNTFMPYTPDMAHHSVEAPRHNHPHNIYSEFNGKHHWTS